MSASGSQSADAEAPLYRNNRYHGLVDSLSFVDAVPVELEGHIRELVEAEKRAILEEFGGDEQSLLESYIKPLGPAPDHTGSGHLYHAEVERRSRGETLQALDMERYAGYDHVTDMDERLDHVRTLSEYAQGAQLNLELMDRYKEAAWLSHLDDLVSLQSRFVRPLVQFYLLLISMSREKTRLESDIEQLNKERKVSNVEWAGRLRTLSQEQEDYHMRNRQLLAAIEKLQNSRQDSGTGP
ncbi:breast carcinoma amplified sequence 2 [Babesia ovata]|uniref:Breast carcinoma amplified sequence 2 n=1 Tax=Babesia ovata TaxID=189622 RepID=A0A2H6KD11_9APIC|nr:breast carcinoma amplified sequence 2 [Babesia ovata]GBE60883.1 breast carcinoma amplified sequence 2 [Babesia ovata]